MKLVNECNKDSLPKVAVEASLYYARVAGLVASLGHEDRSNDTVYRDTAKDLLERAAKLCEQPFKGADILLRAVEQSARLLGKEWYEKVTDAEIAAIKAAMVSGRGGIATHSGHWYECKEGHPVSVSWLGLNGGADYASLPSESVVCLWSWLDAQSVVRQLVVKIMSLLLV
jgi:hypothetical protein